ncbi:Mpp10 protein-domain-containing protein [Favolaschia claudopus]|uniref:Mpp10 protein-domain-containing protein n=1 Tax=Favolaschia claudopus TaxID=2862362 RepID=A0AAW0EFA1_9AGAR
MDAQVEVPKELATLTHLVQNEPTCFSASGNSSVNAAALHATKFVFDFSLEAENASRPHILEFLSSLSPSEAPQTRSQASKKRKRGASPSPPSPPPMFQPTPIAALFTEGMDDDQIWAQLDLRMKPVCEMLEFALDVEGSQDEDDGHSNTDESVDEELLSQMRALESGEDAMDGMEVDDFDDGFDSEDAESEEESDDDNGEDLGEAITGLRDPSSDEDDEPVPDGELFSPRRSRRKPSAGPKNGLDDGFFDLASFNAESEEAEARKVSRGRLGGDDESEEEDDSIDLFAPVDIDENFDEEDENDAGELFYKDFFDPPPRSAPPRSKPKKAGTVRFHEEVRVKNIKPKGKNLPLNPQAEEEDDDDDEDFDEESESEEGDDGEEDDEEDGDEDEDVAGESGEGSAFHGTETIERLKNDLFAEEEDEPPEDLSTHEQRMAALRDQIASLEAENVGPKDWVVLGEAAARSRPQNSLLEEDLDFERVMKAVPVVTEETVLALEERIKARILEGRFDDVVRVRPMEDKAFLPSRFFELKDTKSSQSLAQIYEQDYVAQTTGSTVDDRDGKLQQEHAEIEALWENICSKLDALCNAHFTPKQPKAAITSVSNVSSATLESALPTTKSVATMLAPEEVFPAASSDPRARSELTSAEKKALRSKERKATKKSRDTLNNSVDKYAKMNGIGGVKKQKQAALASVVKSGRGVTVYCQELRLCDALPRYGLNQRSDLPVTLPPTTMSFFKRKDNNKSMIPPVESDRMGNSSSPRPMGNSSSPRPNRPTGSASTYNASRDGDPYSTSRNNSYSSDVKNDYNNDGFQPRGDKYNRNNGVGDVYSRPGGEKYGGLDDDRAALFSGYNAEKTGSGRFFDGPGLDRDPPPPGEETEEDVEGIKKQTRYVKQESANSARNALRLAREAEDTARNTLNRLGTQSERLANTERHLDLAKGHSARADDRTDELNQLNRSIFRPVITFNKDGKRAAQEAKVQARYEDERTEREKTMLDIRDSHNRLGQAQTYGRDGDREGLIGGSRFRSEAQLAARKEQRKRYQFDATGSDDELEDEIDDNLDEIGDATKRLKALGMAMGQELDKQNQRIDLIDQKTVNLDNKIVRNTERLKRVK